MSPIPSSIYQPVMKAVTVTVAEDGSRRATFKTDYPKPEPNPDEVLLRVIHATICGTDLEILRGFKHLHKTQVLGHEFIARTVSFGDSVSAADRERLAPGTTVVGELNCVAPAPPGSLLPPRSRNAVERAHDPDRSALGIFGRDGAFAEFVVLPAVNLHVVPASIPLDRALLTEPVAAAAQIAEQVHIPGTAAVAVIGAGRLGCIAAFVMRAMGKRVDLLSRRALPPAIGLPTCILSETLVEQLDSTYDVVVDCTASPAGLATAIKLTRPLGTIVLKSTVAVEPNTKPVDLTPVVVKEITIVGSRCGPFPVALRLLEDAKLPVERLLTKRFPIEEAAAALKAANERGGLKVMLEISEPSSETA